MPFILNGISYILAQLCIQILQIILQTFCHNIGFAVSFLYIERVLAQAAVVFAMTMCPLLANINLSAISA